MDDERREAERQGIDWLLGADEAPDPTDDEVPPNKQEYRMNFESRQELSVEPEPPIAQPEAPEDRLDAFVEEILKEKEEEEKAADAQLKEVRYAGLMGPAGTGKTFQLRKRLEANPRYAVLTATTGVAAINMGEGVTTVHSQLRFFDNRDCKNSLDKGWLKWKFVDLARRHVEYLVIDEVSMLNAELLDYICTAAEQARDLIYDRQFVQFDPRYKGLQPVGIMLTGDFCQLAPVEGRYAFWAKAWPKFAPNIEKLTVNYRQSNPDFMAALAAARKGRGVECAMMLKKLGVRFVPEPLKDFDGTTLFPVNSQVDKYNRERMDELKTEEVGFEKKTWGKEKGEWKDIPAVMVVKLGARVMILTNESKKYRYVNGDLASVKESVMNAERDWQLVTNSEGDLVRVPNDYETRRGLANDEPLPLRVHRNEHEFALRKLVRGNLQDAEPQDANRVEWEGIEYNPREEQPEFWQQYYTYLEDCQMNGRPYYDPVQSAWVVGEVEYMPVRLGYALTVHKCIHPDTLVMTRSSIVPIKCVGVGDSVFDGSRYVKVLATSQNENVLWRMTTHRGYEVIGSGDHRIETPAGLVELQNLQEAHSEVLICVGKPIQQVDEFGEDWLLGALVGDGWYNDRRDGMLSLGCSDPWMQEKAKAIWKRLGLTANHHKNGKSVHVVSKPYRIRLEKDHGLEYATAQGKSVPSEIFRQRCRHAAFLRGLFDTDGCVSRSGVVLTTVSAVVAKQVHLMLLGLGIVAILRRFDSEYGCGFYYQVRVSASHLPAFKSVVGFTRPYKVEELASCEPRIIAKFDGTDRVAKVENLGIVSPTIDIEVDSKSHLFSAGGVSVSNCQGLTLDKVQLDCRSIMAGKPGLMYVALSRVRNPEGLVVVGDVNTLARRVVATTEVMGWV